MNQDAVKQILDIQEQIRTDTVLMGEYEAAQTEFLKLLSELAENQQNILLDYLGVCIEIHLRMLEESNKKK